MLIDHAIVSNIPALQNHQSIPEAIDQFKLLNLSVLSVVDGETGKLLGQITHEQVLRADEHIGTIGELTLQEPVKIFKNEHLFNATQLMLKYELSMLPVINSEWLYQGAIKKDDVLESLTRMLNITEFGSVITIELNPNDFVLSEIVRIIEIEEAKILGITVEAPNVDIQNYEVSIKLNVKNVSRIASSLRRHGYTIITELESDSSQIDLETRAGELLKYLEV